jgi:hypothetical protein
MKAENYRIESRWDTEKLKRKTCWTRYFILERPWSNAKNANKSLAFDR